ncbi:MAG TPA: carboxypeptidase regulatory-like domain-containing protein, partial [Gemmatimonadales bacterium]|nr:carboxypeptidase regulatory-like domain-containing protein [Gemmatimonadales bacterium]
MKFNHIRRQVRGAVLGFAFLLGGASLAAQGVVVGRVTDAATKQPLQQAQVNIVGTTQRVLTNQDGQYRLLNVPAGTALVRVVYIGYKSESQSAFVTAGASVTADFAMTAAPVGLEAIVVTPSGNASARQEGNNVPTVQLSTLTRTEAITNMSDAINARVPGVVVQQSGGTTGSGTRIRIRGSNSVSLSNDPVLVVDGVRVDNTSSSSTVGVGGQVPSRLNDYNADDIESIQVSEGPSAGVLYGTDAANGAIIMQTKKGHPGPTVWNVNFEGGVQNDVGSYPANYRGVTAANASCRLTQVAAGTCTQANVLTLNPIEQFSPFRTGNLTNMGISASGGNEQTTYYVAGHYNYANGVYSVNTDKQVFLRGNIHHQAASNLIFDVSTGYVTSQLRLPQNDNNVFGVLSSGFLGGTDSTVNQGYGFLTPAQSFSIHTFQLVDHFTGSFAAKYTPRSWLEINATLGNDFISRRDENTDVPGAIPQAFNNNAFIGSRNANPFQIYTYTANVFGTAEFLLTPTVTSRTSAGLQYFRSDLHGVTTFNLGLTAGTGSLTGGVVPQDSEATTETATFGKFVEERVGIRDRVFFTGSLRSDQNTSFGKRFGNILYPKLTASWV